MTSSIYTELARARARTGITTTPATARASAEHRPDDSATGPIPLEDTVGASSPGGQRLDCPRGSAARSDYRHRPEGGAAELRDEQASGASTCTASPIAAPGRAVHEWRDGLRRVYSMIDSDPLARRVAGLTIDFARDAWARRDLVLMSHHLTRAYHELCGAVSALRFVGRDADARKLMQLESALSLLTVPPYSALDDEVATAPTEPPPEAENLERMTSNTEPMLIAERDAMEEV